MLYHNDMSTCAQKVRLTLAEKGQTGNVEFRNLDLRAAQAKEPEYVRLLNPSGVVPTLVDCRAGPGDGKAVPESNDIMRWLDEQYPAPALLPSAAAAREAAARWMDRLHTGERGLHRAIAGMSMSLCFRHQFIALKEAGRWPAANAPPPAVKMQGGMIALGSDAPCRALLEKGPAQTFFVQSLGLWAGTLRDIEEHLARSAYLASEELSLADLAYMPYMGRLEELGCGRMLGARTQQWWAGLKARPSWQEAYGEWVNPSYRQIWVEKCAAEWPVVAELLQREGIALPPGAGGKL